jgi:flavin reductase (DIM6/NTAB) family NADH-FMN oxidoreductase RutF
MEMGADADFRVSYTEEKLRNALSEVPTPVVVVTTLDGDGPLALDQESAVLRKLKATGRFGVSVLAEGPDELAQRCASKAEDKFDAVPWEAEDGVPRIKGAASWFLCETEELVPGGDHEIVVGHVRECARDGRGGSLVYHRRRFAFTRPFLDEE